MGDDRQLLLGQDLEAAEARRSVQGEVAAIEREHAPQTLPLGDANERDSAEFAEGLLAALGVPEPTATEVARLVGLTAGHATEEDDPDGELLCDADLAILAGDDDAYADYTVAIRREYAHVPEDAFRAGSPNCEHGQDIRRKRRGPPACSSP